MANISIKEPSDLLDDERSFPVERTSEKSESSLSTSESKLEVEFADIIREFYDKLKQDAEFVCCCCERLLVRKVLTHFNFTMEKFSSSMWMQLKSYLLEKDPLAAKNTYYVCGYCRPLLNEDKMPGRCVLNGLYTEPVPQELSS